MGANVNDPSTLPSPWTKGPAEAADSGGVLANLPNAKGLPAEVSSPRTGKPESGNATAENGVPADSWTVGRKPVDGEKRSLPAYFGDYVLLEKIGQGGMGIVYRARQLRLNRLVAVKLARRGEAGSVSEARRFHFEAEAAAQLDHPNIVPIHEVGEHAGQAFFSMALVEGESLAEKIAVDPMPARAAARIMCQVADAVEYAHGHGIVHRDLKPGNILIDESGQPRITDFGLAKIANTEGNLTQVGEVLGTPSFMPPEQATGDNSDVGVAADIYSLGATLYALIAGRPPFQSATTIETLRLVLDREPIPPRALVPTVDRDLDTICLKCLAKKPIERYATAAALAADLRLFLEGKSIVARPVGRLEKTLRWCRRNTVAAAALAGFAAAVALAFALVSVSYYQARLARDEEAQQRQAATDREQGERWERYRANIGSAASALRLNNVPIARQSLEAAPPELRNWEWRLFHDRLDLSDTRWSVGSESLIRFELSVTAPRVLAVNQDGSALLFDLARGVVDDIGGGRGHVSVTMAPDGGSTARIVADGEIEVRDDSGKPKSTLRTAAGSRFLRIAFAPDSKRLATAASDGSVRIWEAATGASLANMDRPKGPCEFLGFSDDGSLLTGSSLEADSAAVWESKTGRRLSTFDGPKGANPVLTLSADGARGLVHYGYPHNDLQLVEPRTGSVLATLPGHINQVDTAAFNPNGSRVVSPSWDQTARLWDGRDGRLIAVLNGHTGRVLTADFNRDGSRLLTASDDSTIRLWDGVTGAPVAVLCGHTGRYLSGTRFSRDGAKILSTATDENSVRMWNVAARERDGRLRGHTGFAYDVAFFADGVSAASASWDGTAAIWNTVTGERTRTLAPPGRKPVTALAVHPSGRWLATHGRDGTLRLWDTSSGRPVFECPLATSHFRDGRIAFDPTGARLAGAGMDGKLHLWDVKSGDASPRLENERTLKGHKEVALSVAFARDGSWLATGGEFSDRTIRIWDTRSGALLHTLKGTTFDFYCLAVSRDGRLLASGGGDSTVRFWDTASWKLVGTRPLGAIVYGLSFNAVGDRLACGCSGNSIRLIDIPTFQEVAELHGHDSYIHAVDFSPDGQRLLSASGDFNLRIWQAGPALPASQNR